MLQGNLGCIETQVEIVYLMMYVYEICQLLLKKKFVCLLNEISFMDKHIRILVDFSKA